MSRLPNRATLVALSIIEEREVTMGEQAFATWVEIYQGVQPYDMTGEQMQRALDEGVKRGELVKRRGINGDLYFRGDAARRR